VELVIGTGLFTEFTGPWADVFGGRSTGFERKLSQATESAMRALQEIGLDRGGNAVLAADLD
jgi:uncharacterized protein YbjQ (UPF0145 family)